VAAPAAFRAAPTPTDAANVVGAMLTRWHYIALLMPLALLFIEWKRSRAVVLVLLFAAILLAAAQSLADMRIRRIRADAIVPISRLSPYDPARRQFGLLHGLSSLLLLGQAVAAAAVVVLDE
jgi:hypothetical protein